MLGGHGDGGQRPEGHLRSWAAIQSTCACRGARSSRSPQRWLRSNSNPSMASIRECDPDRRAALRGFRRAPSGRYRRPLRRAGRGMSTLALRSAWRCSLCWAPRQRDRHDADRASVAWLDDLEDSRCSALFFRSCALASHVALEEVGAESGPCGSITPGSAQAELAIEPKGRVPLVTDKGVPTDLSDVRLRRRAFRRRGWRRWTMLLPCAS